MSNELDKACPQCKGEITDHRAGCETCERFQCAACREWAIWDFGGDEDEENRPVCNNCWAEENTDDEDDDGPAELEPKVELKIVCAICNSECVQIPADQVGVCIECSKDKPEPHTHWKCPSTYPSVPFNVFTTVEYLQ